MAARKPRRVEIGLRLDDMVILREAARVGRAALMKRLRDLKAEMRVNIRNVELLDDALGRLDLSIAKVEEAYGSLATDSGERGRGREGL